MTITLDRRRFLGASVGMAAALAAGACLPSRRPTSWAPGSDLFTLGVASGEPEPSGVVLWTRLAPDPLAGGGMPSQSVQVEWEVADDERFGRVVQRGIEETGPELGHSVHAEVRGLDPERWYWYRFRVGQELSPVGRTRTSPAAGRTPDRLAFAMVSCQHYEQGYYTAYRHVADEDLDLVVHLGDYIYEGASAAGQPRLHEGDREPQTLEDYRNRYAQYRFDADLQAAHAAFPWVTTWDDHEVDNNYAADVPEDPPLQSREQFLARRAAAYQAYYEMMPLRAASRPQGPDMLLYRVLRLGQLAALHVMDTRQYRTDQACGDGRRVDCREALDPSRTMIGPDQERWLLESLGQSDARWNVLAQQVFLAQLDFLPGPGEGLSMDAWDGYPAARERLLRFIAERALANTIALTGGLHSHWVADLKENFDDPASRSLGSEFVVSSISSGGDGVDLEPQTRAILAENPHIKFYNGRRGYVVNTLTPSEWRADYRALPFVTSRGAPVTTRASFLVEAGRAGVHQIAGDPAL
ncbi:MAG: alkaline phosphatase D family protein [Actinomycetota bacterium]|nr:alkaline phosphatase D family protein [Actinomycetota bacterium]